MFGEEIKLKWEKEGDPPEIGAILINPNAYFWLVVDVFKKDGDLYVKMLKLDVDLNFCSKYEEIRKKLKSYKRQ